MQENYLERSYLTVAKAIHTLSFHFENIAVPIRNSVKYDLIIEKNSQTYRVKVIATSSKAPSGCYVANLRKSGGYNKMNTQKSPFDSQHCDFLYIHTPEEEYLIPSHRIPNGRQLSMSMCSEFILRGSSEVEQGPVKSLVEGSIPSHADSWEHSSGG